MESKDIKAYLRKVANKLPSEITTDDKEAVRDLCATYGVDLSARRNCKQCYIDAAVVIFNMIEESEQAKAIATDKRRYILKPNVDVYFGGIRVNAATLTDEMAASLLKRGFDKRFFCKYEN